MQILSTLGTEASHRSASQCVAFIAAAELPQAQWPGLIQALLVNMTTNPTTSNTKVTENLKEASLEAIGYICEELVSDRIGGVCVWVEGCVCRWRGMSGWRGVHVCVGGGAMATTTSIMSSGKWLFLISLLYSKGLEGSNNTEHL